MIHFESISQLQRRIMPAIVSNGDKIIAKSNLTTFEYFFGNLFFEEFNFRLNLYILFWGIALSAIVSGCRMLVHVMHIPRIRTYKYHL